MKESNTNNNRAVPSFLLNNHSKGRQLIEDFNKFTIGKFLENDINYNGKIEINQNFFKNNNIPNCNTLNNEFSIFNQNNQKDTYNEQSTQIKNDIL